jgi:F-box/leucine-rich repeat protein 7
LKELSVRGCVRVTGVGVEAVVEGCTKLEMFDVSQCKNLQKWLDAGGEERSRRFYGRRKLRFETRKGDAMDGRVVSLR